MSSNLGLHATAPVSPYVHNGSKTISANRNPPIAVGRFHSLVVDHGRRTVNIETAVDPSDLSEETIHAMRTGEETCERLAILWTGLGYRVEN